ncbi:MAG: hypothetical protein KIT80_13315 [Chitinophagaceae bacterium]|nr:hypothetical protein [Chitinophagaceae bacterium]MCW5927887.1 hypothetical protein [Chitinophagaceae bacterium]
MNSVSGRRLKFFVKTLLLICISRANVTAQEAPAFRPYKKGRMFAYWGWNRGFYSNSDIKLRGDDYNLTLYGVPAHDRVTKPVFNYNDYFKLSRITIPQTNFRIGYFIKDNWAVSAGVDHMKYVMDNNRMAMAKGVIEREGNYRGVYNNNIKLEEDFLTFEHTDGLNYVNAEVEYYRSLGSFLYRALNVGVLVGAGAGALVPKTNVKFLDYERNDRFHLSGFGADLKAGLDLIAFRHLNLKLEAKKGYIDMPDIILHKKGINGKAKQHFWFTELTGTIGVNFSILKQ